MKTAAFAWKDILISFRSPMGFALMLFLPLLISGMFSLMFARIGGPDEVQIQKPEVLLVNLDQPAPAAADMGAVIRELLHGAEISRILNVTDAQDEQDALRRTGAGEFTATIIIPEDFSASFNQAGQTATIEIVSDPARTISPAIVESTVMQIADSFAGVKIAIDQVQSSSISAEKANQSIAALTQRIQENAPKLVSVHFLSSNGESRNPTLGLIATFFVAMMIFFLFFTATSSASTLLQEEERRTLQRVFTTPIHLRELLGGKFLAVFIILSVQISLLLLISGFLFKLDWGKPLSLLATAFATVVIASSFAIFLVSWMKSIKQGGVIFGGVLTITGMVGLIDLFTGNPGSSQFGLLPLISPHGWVSKLFLETMRGASLPELFPWLAGALLISLLFFTVGMLRFTRRFAS